MLGGHKSYSEVNFPQIKGDLQYSKPRTVIANMLVMN